MVSNEGDGVHLNEREQLIASNDTRYAEATASKTLAVRVRHASGPYIYSLIHRFKASCPWRLSSSFSPFALCKNIMAAWNMELQ